MEQLSTSVSDASTKPPLPAALAAYAADTDEELPIGGYAALLGVFLASFTAMATLARHAGKLPRRPRAADLVLLGIATHELSSTITRARVTIPLRAPFTSFQASAGAGEVDEKPRGHGLQRAVGSLLTCQFCTGPWVATGLTAALLFAPRVTRLASGILTVATISDFLHQAYAALRHASPRHPSRSGAAA